MEYMSLIAGLGLLICTIVLMKWIGAWLLGVTNVLDKQDRTDEILKEILSELKKSNEKL